jgi:hypothetical protein
MIRPNQAARRNGRAAFLQRFERITENAVPDPAPQWRQGSVGSSPTMRRKWLQIMATEAITFSSPDHPQTFIT